MPVTGVEIIVWFVASAEACTWRMRAGTIYYDTFTVDNNVAQCHKGRLHSPHVCQFKTALFHSKFMENMDVAHEFMHKIVCHCVASPLF